ncbi:P-type conjugative transfer protein TrbJ [Acidithiobacillus sp.]|uniref:P-type conjugative transfer protein TrbJ n=1 Tax=Acidithiobacillus sp. TaxID=1872118 RepID=UPI003CFD630E
MKQRILSLAILMAMAPAPALAGGIATIAVGGATLPEQLVQEITALESVAKQAQEVQQQIQMVTNQATNLMSLPIQFWQAATGPIAQLIQVANQAQGLSYAAQNIAGTFQQQYGSGTGVLMPQYGQSLQQWTQNTNSQIAAALQQYGLQSSQFATQQQALQSVESASQSASGRMQVLQAANQIAGLEVNQIQSLQQTIMAGQTPMLNYIAKKNNQEQQEQNMLNNFLKSDPSQDHVL